MGKKRRTKKDKMLAAKRVPEIMFFEKPTEIQIKDLPIQRTDEVNKQSYAYVLRESKNAIIVSAVILIFNILFFFSLKQNLVNLFGIEF